MFADFVTDPFNAYITYPSIMALFDTEKDLKIADVGCGDGSLIYYMEKKYPAEYVGIDYSHGMLKLARDKNRRNKNPTSFF